MPPLCYLTCHADQLIYSMQDEVISAFRGVLYTSPEATSYGDTKVRIWEVASSESSVFSGLKKRARTKIRHLRGEICSHQQNLHVSQSAWLLLRTESEAEAPNKAVSRLLLMFAIKGGLNDMRKFRARNVHPRCPLQCTSCPLDVEL